MNEYLITQQDKWIAFRRELHQYPELSNEEFKTAKKIAQFYEDLGIPVQTGVGGNGVVAHLKGAFDGPTVAFRADFDALPIQDEKEVPYRSKIDGVSHACGHDVHTAALLQFAEAVHAHLDQLHGTVVCIHQFAEEVSPGGAERMIAAGCLEGVDVIYGAHVWASEPVRDVLFCPGPAMAAADVLQVSIQGKGGHGGVPHETIDPIVAASQFVLQLQQIVSRQVDPLASAVISIGSIQSGFADNVIPDQAELLGTVRTFTPETRVLVEEKIRQHAAGLAIQTGATVDVNYIYGHAALINPVEETEDLQTACHLQLADLQTRTIQPMMAAEDFSYYLQQVPGTFFYVGGKNEAMDAIYPHHHPKFDVDESTITTIARVFYEALVVQGAFQ